MSKYDDFDTLVLEQIRLRPMTFTQLQHKPTMEAAKPWVTKDRPDWRVLDMRLQALRKAGKIKHHGGQWHYIKATP